MSDVEHEQPRGQVIATVDDRMMRSVVIVAVVALVVGLWVVARGSTEGTIVAAIISAVAGVIVALFLGYGWKLQLTTEGVYYSKRTRLFGPHVVLVAIPLAQLGTVRHWRESRRSDGGSSRYTVGVLQIRDTAGRGFRVSGQLLSRSQLAALQHALAARGMALEFLAKAPA